MGDCRVPKRSLKWICSLFVWLCCGLLTGGCWDSHDINHRSIPVIIGISKGQEKAYKVSLQIPIPAERKLTVKVVSREASTVSAAINAIRVDVENYIDLLSVQLIVFSQELAQAGLHEELTNVIRSRNFSPKALLAITDGDMEELLTNSNNAISNDVTTFYKFSNKRAGWTPRTTKTSLLDAFAATRSYTQDTMIPIIKPGRRTVLEFDGSALLKKGKMVGRLNEEEIVAINVVSNNYYGADVEVMQNASVTIRSAHIDWQSKMTGSGPELLGKLSIQASLTESEAVKSASEHEKELQVEFTKKLENVTNKLVKSGCDPMGLGNHFRSKIPFNKLTNWRTEYYPKLKIKYSVHVVINNLGELVQED
nr:Ger(x)C family spore germination protein [Paenibacillus sp. BK720]